MARPFGLCETGESLWDCGGINPGGCNRSAWAQRKAAAKIGSRSQFLSYWNGEVAHETRNHLKTACNRLTCSTSTNRQRNFHKCDDNLKCAFFPTVAFGSVVVGMGPLLKFFSPLGIWVGCFWLGDLGCATGQKHKTESKRWREMHGCIFFRRVSLPFADWESMVSCYSINGNNTGMLRFAKWLVMRLYLVDVSGSESTSPCLLLLVSL